MDPLSPDNVDALSKADPTTVAKYQNRIAQRKTRCGHPFDSLNTLLQTIESVDFMGFVNKAKNHLSGVAMRLNPMTGKREMMIYGTRNAADWVGNILNTIVTDPLTRQRVESLTAAAERNYIDVIYGHSRGGMYVADMLTNETIQKVGLDAAMSIANNKNLVNLTEAGSGNPGSSFDALIGRTGTTNITVDFSPQNFHKVWTVN